MDQPRCPLCGDTRRLNDDGVCAWSGGCEHRQMVERERMADLDAFLATRPVDLRGPSDDLLQLARRAMLRLTEEARVAGLIGPDEAFDFDVTDLLTYRRDDG